MQKRQTRIPRPVAKPPAEPLKDLNGRKRKEPSSAAAAPAPAAKRAAVAREVPQEDPTWEDLVAEGDSAVQCLSHKLSLKKRDTVTTVRELTLAYIKRLRALGWHLHAMCERLQSGNVALDRTVKAEANARAANKKEFLDRMAVMSAHVESLKESLEAAERECQESAEAKEALRSQLSKAAAAEDSSRAQCEQLEAQAASTADQMQELRQQVARVDELHQQATKYCAQLQEYNGRLQSDTQSASERLKAIQEERTASTEEAARLRGTLSAMDAQLTAAQAAAEASEAARLRSSAEASSLQAELHQARTERSSLAEALAAASGELARYREATGRSLDSLEAERSSAAALATRSKAQSEMNTSLADRLAFAEEARRVAEQLASARQTEVTALKRRLKAAEKAQAIAEQRSQEGELVRRQLHNTILTLKGNIRVFCRVRPVGPADKASADRLESGGPVMVFPQPGETSDGCLELTTPNGNKSSFTFDKVFGPTASQAEVFEEVSQLVQSALDGYKVCIFAYGQTGSGKTFTTLGTPENMGLIPRAVEQLFTSATQLEASQGWSFQMKASMLEVYNEEIKDLLGKGPPAGKKHTVSHSDKTGCTTVSYLEAVDCREPACVAALLQQAARQRAVGATAANERSSRSHMVFTLSVCGLRSADGQQLNGVLNLIDLAGSERLKASGASGERLRETQAINKSLSALGDVITALGNKDASHIPYRNSKLTWLLQPCLGGDAKMLMVANVAPTAAAAAESLCSLRFAAKVNATHIGTARRAVSYAK
ncbi:hypothetical protein CVIRNUC_002414 [Coccomyxa viridis]|uniref:Kinesin-like protein n=1 Tax=Coccomyxa viridis TaxID=1274662 RepID=A0AAV1HXK8_9CHLO|nr:hypothetical protein CVIRNUC_002414 [Coccomyxa viridis]